MSGSSQETLTELYRAIRGELTSELRRSRLTPMIRDVGRNSKPGFTGLGAVTGFEERDFIERFGASLDKVTHWHDPGDSSPPLSLTRLTA